MRDHVIAIVLWTFVGSIILTVCIYSAFQADDVTYWNGAAGNLLATLVGVAVGIPVALAFERARTSTATKQIQICAVQDQINVVELIGEELSTCKTQLIERSQLGDSIPVSPLKLAVWEALKASGELRHLRDTALLGTFADAYHHLSVVVREEERLRSTIFGINVEFQDGEFASAKILGHVKELRSSCLIYLEQALQAVVDHQSRAGG